jgi:predicted PurR-regulated permease PerM
VILDGGFGRSVARGAGLAVGFLIVAALFLVGLAAWNVLVLVFVAVILAAGLEPVIAWLRGHLPIGRGLAILLVYGLFLAIVVAMVLVVVPAALGQLDRTVASLPPLFEQARAWAGTLDSSGLARSLRAVIDTASGTFKAPDGRRARASSCRSD